MSKRTVREIAFKHPGDYTTQKSVSGTLLDELVNSCVFRAFSDLQRDVTGYEKKHRDQMSDVFKGLQYTHCSIRRFLKDMTRDNPEVVDALALLRLQFEYLFAMCLMLEGSTHVDAYIQDYWRKRCVQYLLVREECSALANHRQYLDESPAFLRLLRDYFGITAEQEATVELEELGTPLPAGMTATPLARFPTPGKIRDKVADPDKKRMLERLYVEYEYLCSFAHGLAEANLLRGIFDPEATHRADARATDAQIEDKFQMIVITPANVKSCICVAGATAELTLLYPDDVELSASATKLWNLISEANLLARIAWNLRGKKALRVLA